MRSGIGYKKQKGAKKYWPPYRKITSYVSVENRRTIAFFLNIGEIKIDIQDLGKTPVVND